MSYKRHYEELEGTALDLAIYLVERPDGYWVEGYRVRLEELAASLGSSVDSFMARAHNYLEVE